MMFGRLGRLTPHARRLALGAAAGTAGAITVGAGYTAYSAASNKADDVSVDEVAAGVYGALINRKVNACPMAIRVAWHASGTYEGSGKTGGSDGATMRFGPEHEDPANAGLFIIHDLLLRVKTAMPQVSFADLWTLAGCKAVEFMGGPRVEFHLGRTDAASSNAKYVPPNGRLPDASQGAAHLREVFYRMGFNDRDIVALSGAHTAGRCHKVRSGYDGAWTTQPLRFDNEYFRNLMYKEWKPRKWDGPLQYTDVESETLTMLPTDMALRTDPAFRPIAQEYADDQAAFFRDFSNAFARLVSKGCPEQCQPTSVKTTCPKKAAREKAAFELRDYAMHGSLEHMERVIEKAGGVGNVEVDSVDSDSGRTALHKAAFWGHAHVVDFLTRKCLCRVSAPDFEGDTALHDAARFGHAKIVSQLLEVGADSGAVNNQGHTALSLAEEHGKKDVTKILEDHVAKELAAVAKARRESFLMGGAQRPLR
jgi:hypothetical protein